MCHHRLSSVGTRMAGGRSAPASMHSRLRFLLKWPWKWSARARPAHRFWPCIVAAHTLRWGLPATLPSGRWPMLSPKAVSGHYARPA
eukprot:3026817-Prymnesium_polylepis.2